MSKQKKKLPKEQTRSVCVLDQNTNMRVVEAYKELLFNIQFTLPGAKCRSILLTSANAMEGKTTTAANLSISLARNGAKVLLIDADLRKPRAHVLMKIRNTVGLSDAICGAKNLGECVFETSVPNLFFIPSGPLPPNPTELLNTKEMEQIIAYFHDRMDYIIFDTPPLNVVSDCLSLVNKVDGCILITKRGKTRFDDVAKALRKLELADAKVLGTVLNDDSIKNAQKYGYNYHYGA